MKVPWQWPRGNPKTLAGFVNPEAGRYLPPLPFSTDDLRHLDPHNRVRRIAEAIYDALAAQGIYYELDHYEPGATATQVIRQPEEILAHKRGTCLDLAVLFCGACLTYELIPVLLVTEDERGGRHALAVVSLTHELRDCGDSNRRLHAELSDNDPQKPLFGDMAKLQEAVVRGAYLAIECTGFAHAEALPAPTGFVRVNGRLSFDGAVAAGMEHLQGGRHLFALDVAVAQGVWKIPVVPLADYRGDWDALHRQAREAMDEVRSAVGELPPLPRTEELAAVAGRLSRRGCCLIVGESGSGKSSIAKRTAERYQRVVWPTGDLLESGSLVELQHTLGLRNPIGEVLRTALGSAILVLDGLEGYSDRALHLAERLIKEAKGNGVAGSVHILLGAQFEAAPRVIDRLAELGVDRPWLDPLAVNRPTEELIGLMLGGFPQLRWATLQPELRPILTNLKVLDWLVRALQSGTSTFAPQEITGLTGLIERLWERWVEGDGGGSSRSGLLQKLGEIEAETLSAGVPVARLEHSERQTLPSLVTVDLLKVRQERVRFAHDLLGDWARLRLLVGEHIPSITEMRERAALPRWHRAIRLFGQSLLERGPSGVESWRREIERAADGSDYGVILRDLLLESVALADNAADMLRAVWPVLVAEDGQLLERLLDRFLYVATVPDPRIAQVAEDSATAAQLEHVLRVPFEAYWHGVLPVLAEHPEDVIRCALAPVAKLLRLWLSTARANRQATQGLRRAAAGLTLIIAREVQAQEAEDRRSIEKEVRTDVYVALLWAVPEYPDEATQICLELANRRAEADQVRLRRQAAREEDRLAEEQLRTNRPEAAPLTGESVTPVMLFGPKRPPWADGPSHRVDEAFQTACLDRQASLALVVNRPQEALEILLAVLMEHPKRPGMEGSYFRESLGLDDNQCCHPPFYYQGPFWFLLRCGQETAEFAVSLIIRVVNFATERWQEDHLRTGAKRTHLGAEGPSCVVLPTPTGWKEFPGDRNVLAWHDGWAPQPDVLSSMLMAVEKWLYDEVDAGRPIDRWVGRILNEGKSAALIGVLVLLAKYKPQLMAGPLLPVGGSWEVYALEARLQMERASMAFWPMAWVGHGEAAWNRARDWYTMPHRKTTLLNHVTSLVLQDGEVRSAVLAFHEHWEGLLKTDPSNKAIRGAVNHFGVLARYFRAAAEGGEKMPDFYAWLGSQQAEAAAAQAQANEELLPLTLAPQCRKRIDENQPLLPDELIPFWNALQRLTKQPVRPSEGGTQAVDAVIGGVALLLLLHREWVREDSTREKWCRDQLEKALHSPPGRRPYDFPDSVGGWDLDTFAAECGVVLLGDDAGDQVGRQLVLAGLTCFRYATVSATVRLAYRLRDRLGGEFDRMLEFVAEWSSLRWALEWSNRWGLDIKRLWTRQCLPRINVFVSGGEAPRRRSLADIDDAGRRLTASLFAVYRTKCERHGEGRLRSIARWTGLLWLINLLRACLPTKKPESRADADDGILEADSDHPTLYRGVPPTWPGLDLRCLRLCLMDRGGRYNGGSEPFPIPSPDL